MFIVFRNLVAHPLRSILTALAITLGVAMVLAAAIIGQAANERAQQASGATGPQIDLEAASRDTAPFSADALSAIRANEQVELASASFSLSTQISSRQPSTPDLQLLGVDSAYATLHQPELTDGTFLPDDNSIVLPVSVAIRAGLHTGDVITLQSGDHTASVTVSGRLKQPPGSSITQAPSSIVSLKVAQQLAAAPGQVDRVEIKLRPGADVEKVRAELAQTLDADLAVVRATSEGGPTFNTLMVQVMLVIVGLIILFAAAFVIMNAFAMSITARTQEIGTLRTLGMTRRQILNVVLAEAGLLGLAGAAAGALAGVGIAWVAMFAMGTLADSPFVVPLWAVGLSPLMGLAVTLAATLPPAWRASHISPMEAVRPEAAARSGWYARHGSRLGAIALGLAVVGLPAYGLIVRPDYIAGMIALLVGIGALLAAMTLLLPGLVGPVAAFARPLLMRWMGTAGRLAADNVRRDPVRAALTAGALAAGLTMIIATTGLFTAMLKGGLQVFGDLINEDRVVLFNLPQALVSGEASVDNLLQLFVEAPPVDPELRARLAKMAADGQIEIERMDQAPIPQELSALPNYPGIFVDPEPFIRHGNFDFFEGDPETAIALMKRGRAFLTQPLTAEKLGVHAGDTVTVQTSQGEVEFTVAGVGGMGWQMTVFPYADGQAYFDVGEPAMMGVFVTASQAARRDEVLRQVDELVKGFPDQTAIDFSQGFTAFNTVIDQFAGLLNALLMMAAIVAALGVVNTMVINVTERRREIGMLRAIGATQRQVRQAVVAEAAVLGLLAALVAVVFSLLILLAFVLIMAPNGTASIGFRTDLTMALRVLVPALRDMSVASAFALMFGPLVAVLAAYYPAREAAALDVIAATRSEQLTLQPPAHRREEGDPERVLPRSLTLLLAQKSIAQQRTRVTLSIIAVTLGATMTVAGDVLSKSIIGVVTRTEDLRAIGEGLWSQLDPMFKGIGAGIMLAAGFLIFNTFAMSITQRRQQIGALRCLGMTRGQVLRMVLAEALGIGVVGTALGLMLGPLLGQGIIAFMRSLDNSVLNAFAPSQPSALSFILAAVMGLGITVLASLVPAWQAMRLSPLTALRSPELPGVERSPIRLGLAGLLLCSVLMVYVTFAPPAAWIQPPYDAIAGVLASGLWIVGLALMLPALVGVLGTSLRPLLARLWGATGRLMADNLQRGRGRVLLTVVTLAISLTMIGALTGFIQFYLFEFFGHKLETMRQEGNWVISAMNIEGGLAGYADMESLRTPPDAQADLRAALGQRGDLMPFTFVIVPQLSFMGDTYFSFILDPQLLRRAGPLFITFKEGDWDSALPVMERGCGVLVTPFIANKNHVGLGNTFTVTGPQGEVECTVAGIGSTFVGASIISSAAQTSFDSGDPFSLFVQSRPGTDLARLEADLQAPADRHGLYLLRMSRFTDTMLSVFDNVPVLFNAFLLMAVLAAALGVVNTTMLSVTERRREFGQLRALGATRAQVRGVVVGEAALMGFLGGLVGLVASLGLTVIFTTVYGGGSVGVENYQPWAAALRTLPKVWPTGLAGLLLSPVICALAAYWPANSVLRGAAIETLNPEQQQPITRQRIVSLLSRGSIPTRFALGTSVLLLAVLASLIQVVTAHARNYLVSQLRDSASALVGWNATMVELSLPAEAQTIDLTQLQQAQGQSFNSDSLLRFRSLIDDMTKGGLEQFAIADRDNVVVVSFDQREIGATLDPVTDTQQTVVQEVTVEGDDIPRVAAIAPIHNKDGDFVGSLRLTLQLSSLKRFLDRVRNTLWGVGIAVLVLGLFASWALSAPFGRAARDLAGQAGRAARGVYSPIAARRSLIPDMSIRTRLTVLMTLLVVLMVGSIGLIVVPIERDQLERTGKDGMLTVIRWVGDFISDSVPADFSAARDFDLAGLFATTQNLDFAKLQELAEQTRGQNTAYLTIADTDGNIVLSDKLALIGEKGPTAAAPQITDGDWRDDPIWIASTPLRQGREGTQIGTLSAGFSRAGVESFLKEAQNLFWLTGLIAALGGLLLAQTLGGAVAAPVESLVTGTQRVARGDLSVRFRTGSRDELAQLGAAFNAMVAGLREREQLRDLFGRYVSPEVREAIESGRVTLAGERKTITVLYCDMRGSTAFAERHKPEEVMAALNQYFEVIILAVEAQGGIVNRFVGDAAVCVFGAPTEYPDHAERALSAALSMREGLAYLNAKRTTLGQPVLKFGIGLNSGDVVAGATGSAERQEYTLIGDAMNVGARIEQLTRDYPDHEILLSEYTRAALGEAEARFQIVDVGSVELRGKSHPVQVLGLVKAR